jgi:hypothetical protein
LRLRRTGLVCPDTSSCLDCVVWERSSLGTQGRRTISAGTAPCSWFGPALLRSTPAAATPGVHRSGVAGCMVVSEHD